MTRKCPRCGKQSSGKFCIECGAPLGSKTAEFCDDCGGKLAAKAAFCGECGKPVGARTKKPASAYMPWVVTSLALIVFIVAMTFFVRQQAGPRAPGEPSSGGVIPGPGASSNAGGGVDLASMSPRQAADRLFDRTMREAEAGGSDRLEFFAEMGLQAYDALPPDEIDADVHFHRGLLHLQLDDSEAANEEAATIFAEAPDHLLGLILAARSAELSGDAAAAAEYRGRFRALYPEADLSVRPEYVAHQLLLEGEFSVESD